MGCGAGTVYLASDASWEGIAHAMPGEALKGPDAYSFHQELNESSDRTIAPP